MWPFFTHSFIRCFFRTLRCKNLVSLIGVSIDEPPICLVTEFMGKGSLEEYLRTRGRSVIPKKSLYDFSRLIELLLLSQLKDIAFSSNY